MYFWLCNKEYEWDLTPDALRTFQQRTGSCLISKSRRARVEFSKAVQLGLSNEELAATFGEHLTFECVSYMLHSLAKQKSSVTLEEIQDGLLHVGDVPKLEENGGRCESWIMIVLKVAADIDKIFEERSAEKKS